MNFFWLKIDIPSIISECFVNNFERIHFCFILRNFVNKTNMWEQKNPNKIFHHEFNTEILHKLNTKEIIVFSGKKRRTLGHSMI